MRGITSSESSNNQIIAIGNNHEELNHLSVLLINEGYIVNVTDRYQVAMQAIENHHPALILVDTGIRGFNSFELCRQLKLQEKNMHIPVIFMGACDDKELMAEAYESGGADYLSRPFFQKEVLAKVRNHLQLSRKYSELNARNKTLEKAINGYKNEKLSLEERTSIQTPLLDDFNGYAFDELFNINDLQKLQDQFADAFGIASIITTPDGVPITQPSKFSKLCQQIIRKTEKGLKNCMHSDSIIGCQNLNGPIVMPCLSGGLMDAGASITVGGRHVANWLIGQIRNEHTDENKLKDYAKEIGADEQAFMDAYYDVTPMSQSQFQKIAEVLFTMAKQLSVISYQNVQQLQYINYKKQAEAALIESEERFRTILYSIGDGVITTDTEGRVKVMNSLAEHLTGWTQTEASGRILEEVFHIVHEETRALVEIPVRRVLREGIVVGLANHTVLISKDGTEYPIADSGAPIWTDKGEIAGVVLVFRDQSVEREAEHALRESEKRFKLLYENAPLSYQSLDNQARLIDINPTWLQTLGYQREEVIGRYFGDFMTPESAELIQARFGHFVASGEIHNYQFEMVKKDGTTLVVSYDGKIGYDELGHFQKTHCIFTDITERKKAEEALTESEYKFRSLFENSSVGISITSIDGSMNTNRAFNEMLGYRDGELQNINWRDVTHPDDIKMNMEILTSLVKGEVSSKRFDKRYFHKNGSIVWADVSITLQRDSNDQPAYYISSINDITKHKIAEETLRNSEFFFRESQRAAFIGSYNLDLTTGLWESSEVLDEIFGIDKDYTRDIEGWNKLFFPEDLVMMKHHLKALKAENIYSVDKEYRIVRHSTGEIRWVNGKGQLNVDKDGKHVSLIGTIQDITARKRTEEALRESEGRYDAFVNANADMIFVKDDRLRYLMANDAMARFFGKTKQELINKTDEELTDRNHFHSCMTSDLKVLESDSTYATEEKMGERIYETTKFPLQLSGNKKGIGGIIRDITENKISAEQIKNERQLLRTVIDNLPATIFVKDCEARKIIANKADLEIMGAASEAEVLGKTDLETFNNEIGKRGYEDDLMVIKTGRSVINREEKFFNKDGEQQWLLTSKIPLLDQKGNIIGLVGIGRDITAQKKANETILKFSKSIEQSPSTIVITDVSGNIEYVNPTFTEVTGFTLEDVMGKNPRILKSGQMAPDIYTDLWATLKSGEVWRGEFLNKKKNGELYWEWATMTSIKNEEGIITNYISIKEDISSRKKMEADLIIAKNKAEENDRLKSAFLANMSHEIRTPLNSIIGFSELLSDPGFESEQRYEFARIITNSGNNLLAIISDIMDISKIEAGQVEIRKNVFSMKRLIHEIYNEYHIKAKLKGIELHISRDLSPDEMLIESDQTKVKQVLVNFVGNALKFTEKGTIEIGAKVTEQSIQLFVKDTGIGIPEQYHGRIFERFRQVEGSYTRKYGGNGLGLAISKSLIEMLGGTIEMQSKEGKGSTFYFTLPDVLK